jgi:Asp-tRNA(Asn)/Glu-tRNA(Gln) amidotransferase A subunit family amidase
LRIALCLQLGDFPIEAEIERNTRAAAERLAAAGATVVEVELPWTMEKIYAASQAHFSAIFGSMVAAELSDHGDLLTAYARKFASAPPSTLSFVEGMGLEGELYRPLGELLSDVDALICPTMGTRGFPIGEDYVDSACAVNGIELENYLLGALTLPFNIASRCPVLSVPSGIADNGVPTGVQIVGRTYDDITTFRIAHALEAAVGGFARLG